MHQIVKNGDYNGILDEARIAVATRDNDKIREQLDGVHNAFEADVIDDDEKAHLLNIISSMGYLTRHAKFNYEDVPQALTGDESALLAACDMLGNHIDEGDEHFDTIDDHYNRLTEKSEAHHNYYADKIANR